MRPNNGHAITDYSTRKSCHQLVDDALFTPQGILVRYLANQRTQLSRDRRAPFDSGTALFARQWRHEAAACRETSGHVGVVRFRDAPRLLAERAQLRLIEFFPAVGNRDQPPLLLQGLECEPAAAIAPGERDAPLIDDSPIASDPLLGPLPRDISRPAALRGPHSPLNARRLGIPHLPVRAISVNESSIRHSYL